MNNCEIIDGGECDIDELTYKIFTKDVKPPKSNQLSFENITLKEVFEALLTFTVNGMKIKYSTDGKTVDIEKLTDIEFAEIVGYVKSIGFNLVISTYSKDEFNENIFPWFIQFNNLPYDQEETDLTKYQYLISKNNCYIISFDFIR
tara:strand:+ start:167 stop:604 length:438 start_codon:yes stop_codon:yes gene_type:complete